MCQETVWNCLDCGAERTVAWHHCYLFWSDYANMLDESTMGVKPDPTFCPLRERQMRPFNLGACPNLDHCPSKPRHEERQARERLHAAAADARRQEQEERRMQAMDDFAREYFVKIPIPGAPACPEEMNVTPPVEELDVTTKTSQEHQEEAEKEASPTASPRPLLRRKGRVENLSRQFAAGEQRDDEATLDTSLLSMLNAPMLSESEILEIEEQKRQASWARYIAARRISSGSSTSSKYYSCPCSPIEEVDEEVAEEKDEAKGAGPLAEKLSPLFPNGFPTRDWGKGPLLATVVHTPSYILPGDENLELLCSVSSAGTVIHTASYSPTGDENIESFSAPSSAGTVIHTTSYSPTGDENIDSFSAPSSAATVICNKPCSQGKDKNVSPTGAPSIASMVVRGRPYDLTQGRNLSLALSPPPVRPHGNRPRLVEEEPQCFRHSGSFVPAPRTYYDVDEDETGSVEDEAGSVTLNTIAAAERGATISQRVVIARPGSILSHPAVTAAWNRLRNPEPLQRFRPQLPSPIPIPVPGRGYPRAPEIARRWFS
ncbi:hypothetical protein HRG_010940 [Hirsutella rhossiliensis]|uniref:Uncharacterized protein n=1 Tax=Hirsutella rhossiliensis TaxID=111463 RepID=A0A9P8MMS8_9HYPO|nr:uncharacterized protein HRG_10940 [Hirsutella rhossiliensis]KAH0957847.1 hypothetical protein HRG_10940 [Hirsutella rhossiliensis]